MENIIRSIEQAIKDKNWYAALFVSLTLPDLCVALRDGVTSGGKYAEWFDDNLSQYQGFLSGKDCYALRCALLHQGKDDISDQRIQEVLDYYIFMTEGAHKNVFKDCIIGGGEKVSLLQLNVQKFCKDIANATENWLTSVTDNSDVQNRLKDTIEIHEPGYNHKGVIIFG